MTCPICKQKSRVTNTAAVDGEVLRRRECKACGWVFFTRETEAKGWDRVLCSRALNAKKDGRL